MNTNNTNTNTHKTIQLNLSFNRRQMRRLHSLIDDLFHDYSKLLVIRMDFFLLKDYQDANSYEHMNELFKAFRNSFRHNQSLHTHYIAYVSRLEYGKDRRWHFHVLFFYDGQRLKDDYGLAKRLGEYWVNTVTRGLGDYHSANMNKSDYEVFAVGMIDYKETHKINNLKAVSNYLVKDETGLERFLRAQSSQRLRFYRQSPYKPKESLVGRPREY